MLGLEDRDPAARDQQTIFCDGVSFLSNSLTAEYRSTINWMEYLVQFRPDLAVHVFVSGDVASTVAHGKPCCVSFSYVTRRRDVVALAVHVSAQFSRVLFNSPLFGPLRNALLDPSHPKVCATGPAALEAHAVLQRLFRINVTTFRALAETNELWSHHFRSDQLSIRTIVGYIRRLMSGGNYARVDEQVIVEAVTAASYSLSSASALHTEESNNLKLVVAVLHRTIVGVLSNEFDRRRRIATGGP
jgi:hypothetical protein